MGGGQRAWTLLVMGVVIVGVQQVGAVDYCRNRKPFECCNGLDYSCEVTMPSGAFCYCDEGCLDDTPVDCCPDYEEVCLGIGGPDEEDEEDEEEPWPGDEPGDSVEQALDCDINGIVIPYGEKDTFNCNECKCEGPEVECESDPCMVEDDLIRTINTGPRRYGWRATNYTQFWGKKLKDGLKLRTGAWISELVAGLHPVIMRFDPTKIPRSFDARAEWLGRITGVRDQGWCGAAWVFSTLGVAQDRFNIVARGSNPVALSAQNLLSCADLDQEGCTGGYLDQAWGYLRRTGVVLEECYLYENAWSSTVRRCRQVDELHNPDCKRHYKYEPSYRLSSKEEDIQHEILTNGPVQAMMTVYPDFFVYRTGVYAHTGVGGEEGSSHAVKIMGWGVKRVRGEGRVKFWLVENSWGEKWGEKGFFKIRRGTNECGIESLVLAVRPREYE